MPSDIKNNIDSLRRDFRHSLYSASEIQKKKSSIHSTISTATLACGLIASVLTVSSLSYAWLINRLPGGQSIIEEIQIHEAAAEDLRQSKNIYKQKGVYLTASSTGNQEYLQSAMDQLNKWDNSTMVIDVKGSYVYIHSAAPIAQNLNLVRPLYDLPEIVERAHENNIYVIGRFIALKDPLFSALNPDAQIRHPNTKRSVGNVWVDALSPATLEYNKQILRDVIASGIDEVNLDYIRYPTEYPQKNIGLTGNQKADHIEPFIRMARELIDEMETNTMLGISTYAILGWNFPVNLEPLGQDVIRFAPLVDVISPMAYPSTFSVNAYYNPQENPGSRMYHLVYTTLKGYQEILGPEYEHKLRPWIQGYSVTAKNMQDQIKGVYDTGLCGFTVWNANNNYGIFYQEMAKVEVPEECR